MRHDRTTASTIRAARMLVAAAFLTLAVCACSGPTRPDTTADSFLDALKSRDYEQAATYLAPGTTLRLLLPDAAGAQAGTLALVDFSCKNLTYEITGSETAGDSSAVHVAIGVPDMTGLLQDYLREALVMALVDKGDGEQDLRTALQTLLQIKVETFAATQAFDLKQSDVTLTMVRSGDRWTIQDAGNLEFAMIGGFEQLFGPEEKS